MKNFKGRDKPQTKYVTHHMQSKKIKQHWEQALIQSMDLHMRMIGKTPDKGYTYTCEILTHLAWRTGLKY